MRIFCIWSILYILSSAGLLDHPIRYGPFMTNLGTLLPTFCFIRNDVKLTRKEADARIEEMIKYKGGEQLTRLFNVYKLERAAAEIKFWRKHKLWVQKLSEEAQKVDSEIQEIRNETNISYYEECRLVNKVKARAAADIRNELNLRLEDCNEFRLVRPSNQQNRCNGKWDARRAVYLADRLTHWKNIE